MTEGDWLWPQPNRAACGSPTSPGEEGGREGDTGTRGCHAVQGPALACETGNLGQVLTGWFSVTPEAGHLRAWFPTSLRRENIHCPACLL